MATVSRRLPEQPHLDVPKREARELLNQWRNGRSMRSNRHSRREEIGLHTQNTGSTRISGALS
jgi:hypothetical protein